LFKKFDYYAPKTLAELFELTNENNEAQILAGGTDLLLKLREKTTPHKMLIDIKKLDNFRGIETKDGYLRMGALTTIREIQASKIIREKYTALYDAAKSFGCLEIRNRATIGGNIVHASPGAEFGTPLFVLAAEAEVIGPDGTRVIPIHEFWQDVYQVDLKDNEVLAAIRLPYYEKMVSRYHRLSRVKGMDLAIVGVSVLALDPANIEKREVKIAMGAVARIPFRNKEVETMLSGVKITNELLVSVKEKLSDSIAPRSSSLRAKPAYKKAMVGNLTEQALLELGLLEEGE